MLDKFLELALELEVEGIMKEDSDHKALYGRQNNELETGDHRLELKGSELRGLFETENKSEGNSFETKNILKTDLQTNEIDILERFSCDLCDKGFFYIYQLNDHKEMKHEGKKYECDLCDKSWAKEKQLKIHKEIKHEGLRYDCDDCGFKSVSRKNLKSHRDFIHAGIGVDCDICGNKYSTSWSVTSHKFKVHGISKQA